READKIAAERTIKTAGSGDERTVIPRDNLVAGNAVIEPRDRETKVAAAVPGRIARIAVHEGERVSKGALLVQLEDSPERAALQAAEADLAAARARAALSAEAYRRIAQAAKGAAATSDDLDRALRQAQSDSLSAEAYRARREQARSDWERLGVRAPIDGEILQVKSRAGEYETPGGDPLVVMGDVSVLRARVDVDERDIGRIALGNGAFVVADAFPNEMFTGKVVEIGRRMGRKNVRTDDPTERIDTKIVETVIELDRTNGLVPGMLVTGYINPTK
ncbi:MAG TPA: efflux RND transporter periplasmic adaptor subunit, partial [Bacteroidota bacterium]|nr:efflux RND transporter periplasmic adaptor subunit [Bacteroidota bacterium]